MGVCTCFEIVLGWEGGCCEVPSASLRASPAPAGRRRRAGRAGGRRAGGRPKSGKRLRCARCCLKPRALVRPSGASPGRTGAAALVVSEEVEVCVVLLRSAAARPAWCVCSPRAPWGSPSAATRSCPASRARARFLRKKEFPGLAIFSFNAGPYRILIRFCLGLFCSTDCAAKAVSLDGC